MNIQKDSAGYVTQEYILSKGFEVYGTIEGYDMGQMGYSLPQYQKDNLKIEGGLLEYVVTQDNKEVFRGWWNSNEEFDKTLESINLI